MKKIKIGLLAKVGIAIALGICCGLFFPVWAVRLFTTINGLFGNFLDFVVPLIILGLVAPGIAELGKGAGKLLLVTVILAYGFTLFSGFFSFFSCEAIYPVILKDAAGAFDSSLATDATQKINLDPYFTVAMPQLFGVMSALILAFVLGLGLAFMDGGHALRNALEDFRDIINRVISGAIIPLLPLFIFGIFLKMTAEGEVARVMGIFIKIIVLIFILTLIVLLFQFSIAGIVGRKNPLKLLRTMLTAYATALGTQSSAATIPVTLQQTLRNGVNPQVAGSVIPLCATIHLSGSTLKIVACSMAVMLMTGNTLSISVYAGFICMLGITMVAAPGVPGGAIMAAVGILQSMLGFDTEAIGLMIALYITMDSFGTACNVTGDGAIAVIVDRIFGQKKTQTVTTKAETDEY